MSSRRDGEAERFRPGGRREAKSKGLQAIQNDGDFSDPALPEGADENTESAGERQRHAGGVTPRGGIIEQQQGGPGIAMRG